MKKDDFKIGLEFTDGHLWYRCTDIGTRTVLGVCVIDFRTHTRIPQSLLEETPTCLEEKVFDETELKRCYIDFNEHIHTLVDKFKEEKSSIVLVQRDNHFVKESLRYHFNRDNKKYPFPKVLSRPRLQNQYEIAPLGASFHDQKWWVLVGKETEIFEMEEADFLALPLWNKVAD